MSQASYEQSRLICTNILTKMIPFGFFFFLSGGLESDSTALYLQKRIEMHRSISCEVATCSLFEQDNMIDHIAIARMIYPARLVFFKPPHGPLKDVPQVSICVIKHLVFIDPITCQKKIPAVTNIPVYVSCFRIK